MKKRSSGILMHISSLEGDYGIGDFGSGAYKFVDFLHKAKQGNWQILPLGVTGYGDSPYQCFSAFAGNPYFIDLDDLIDKGYLKREEVDQYDLGKDPRKIDYSKIYKNKMLILRLAYKRAGKSMDKELEKYFKENKDWLRDFSLFMSLKSYHNNEKWGKWGDDYKIYNSPRVLDYEKNYREDIYFWVFTQYFFSNQWERLKKYANSKNIKIIGDLPIYVAEDSSDVWSNPSYFKLDKNLVPISVSGCPPDDFSDSGQLWGNPIYNWKFIEEDKFSWWIKRIDYSFKLFDSLRIDHFRGFESYWEVDYGAKTAAKGKWVKGPGMKLFNQIKRELGDLDIIVEDLGLNTIEVDRLVEESGFPNMKVLQFAFDPEGESEHIPHLYNKNTVVYTGTHDNHTVIGWFMDSPIKDVEYAIDYLKLDEEEGINWGIIRGAWSSVSNLALAPMQDFLGLGDFARMNEPSTSQGNWKWRILGGELNDELAKKIGQMSHRYRRA